MPLYVVNGRFGKRYVFLINARNIFVSHVCVPASSVVSLWGILIDHFGILINNFWEVLVPTESSSRRAVVLNVKATNYSCRLRLRRGYLSTCRLFFIFVALNDVSLKKIYCYVESALGGVPGLDTLVYVYVQGYMTW